MDCPSSNSKIRKATSSVSEVPQKVRKISSELDETENVKNNKIEDKLEYGLLEAFPDICPTYVRQLCGDKAFSPMNIEVLISSILETGEYPKRTFAKSESEEKLKFEEQLEMMKQLLPEADPDYLEMNCVRWIDKQEELERFITEAIEKINYPTKKEYLRKQKLLAQQKQFTTEFNVVNFLELIPDPVTHFQQQERKSWASSVESEHYAMCFLGNRYRMFQMETIREQLRKAKTLLTACNNLENLEFSAMLKTKRPLCPMATPPQDIPLLQEIAFKEHYVEITQYLEEKKTEREKLREQCKRDGLMEACQCCYDDEVIPSDVYTCEVGCKFCKYCVKKSAEVTFGEGKLVFKCLSMCEADFSLQTLQDVLPPKLFSQIASRKQLEEIKSAGIEDLEMCPFCNFATIPAKNDKLFRCSNPDCMKETCRQCKEPSHIPLRCEEVEKEADVKVRTYIEDKMTEALLRKCWKCGIKFIKSDGCNIITCYCGAQMCYICNAPVTDHKHFKGIGNNLRCPMFSDTPALHEREVMKGAQSAKQEMSGRNKDGDLKIDPTADLKRHYDTLGKKYRTPPVLPINDAFENSDEFEESDLDVSDDRSLNNDDFESRYESQEDELDVSDDRSLNNDDFESRYESQEDELDVSDDRSINNDDFESRYEFEENELDVSDDRSLNNDYFESRYESEESDDRSLNNDTFESNNESEESDVSDDRSLNNDDFESNDESEERDVSDDRSLNNDAFESNDESEERDVSDDWSLNNDAFESRYEFEENDVSDDWSLNNDAFESRYESEKSDLDVSDDWSLNNDAFESRYESEESDLDISDDKNLNNDAFENSDEYEESDHDVSDDFDLISITPAFTTSDLNLQQVKRMINLANLQVKLNTNWALLQLLNQNINYSFLNLISNKIIY